MSTPSRIDRHWLPTNLMSLTHFSLFVTYLLQFVCFCEAIENNFKNKNWFIHSSFSEGKLKGRGEMLLFLGMPMGPQNHSWETLPHSKRKQKNILILYDIYLALKVLIISVEKHSFTLLFYFIFLGAFSIRLCGIITKR